MLNYIVVRQKWCKSVSNCEINLATTMASDHNLVKADVNWVLKNNKKGVRRACKDLQCLKMMNVRKPLRIMSKSNKIQTRMQT